MKNNKPKHTLKYKAPRVGSSLFLRGDYCGTVIEVQGDICIYKTETNEMNSFIWRLKRQPFQVAVTDSEGYIKNKLFKWESENAKTK